MTVIGIRREGLLPARASIQAYLLDADDDLAGEFDVRTRLSARQGTTVRIVHAEVGECNLGAVLAEVQPGFGLLLLDGLIALDVKVGSRTATELIGAGDLLQPYVHPTDEILERDDAWHVLAEAKLALLDAEFCQRARPWPQISRALLRRAGRRTSDVDTVRAISCHPRLEVRLDLLFWHLASRWGRVEPSGIHLMLPLTHRLLGQLVAAERPSVSHAMARLSNAGLITGTAGDWHLHGNVEDHLDHLAARGAPSEMHIAEHARR
ncbi:MAG TPA: helix-turn-helix domain-containing protein [Solirubrobacteraceae bacterium]|nr:helix-turn-helix domain-containing protein [Solirubrobacteraceae bacterium]